MRPLAHREKRIVEVAVGLLCFFFLYTVGLEPFLKEWRQTERQIDLLETKLKRSALLAKKRSKIEKEFQHYAGFLQPEDPDQIKTQTLSEIEKVIRGKALKIVEMRPMPVRQQGLFQEYVVDVILEGTMGQLVQLIYQLPETSGLLRVERLQISAKGSNPALLKAVMTVTRLSKE